MMEVYLFETLIQSHHQIMTGRQAGNTNTIGKFANNLAQTTIIFVLGFEFDSPGECEAGTAAKSLAVMADPLRAVRFSAVIRTVPYAALHTVSMYLLLDV